MNKELELKDQSFNIQGTTDFWYDLFDGGYIPPNRYLNPDDAKRVNDAIFLLEKYKKLLMEDNEIIQEL